MSDKSVQVALRIRPLVPSEISKGCKNVFEVYPNLNQVKIKNTDKAFTYNYVFEPSTTQDYVYKTCVKGMIKNLFNGYNVTVLAYGQTGSGKTHTMGSTYNGEGEMGVIPRAITEIFNTVRENFVYDVSVTVSFVELYQETLYDLLAEKSRDQCILDIREDPSKGVVIPGLTQVQVDSTQSVFQALIRGSSSRVTGATNMNAQSARSHAIFSVNMTMINKKDGNEKTAKFHLVDLAGSERPKKTGAVGTTFEEGVNINKGLLVLGNVISALADEKQQHGYISYRDSKLTRFLKDSLGGNSITLMIACVSPADYNIDESISTLRYADRARRIQNKPIVNQDPKAAEINLLKKTIQDLKLQIVGQGGPAVSSNELTSLREENVQLHTRIRDLTLQLSSSLHDNTSLFEKLMILQNANENLHKKIQELKQDDRATLQQQFDKLRDDPENLDESQVQEIESDIEMRSVQIQDLQQKLLDSEEENKKSKNKMIETQAALDDFKHKFENLEKVMKIFELKNNQDLAQLQKDNEEKIAVLLRHLRGVEVQDGSEELKQRCAIQSEQIENLERKNQELMEKLHETQQQAEELKEKIDTILLAKESEIREAVAELKTPVENMRRKKIRIKREFDSTFNMENQENFDVSMEELDDIANDPDWRITPIGKLVLENKRRTNAGVENMALKRTSNGGCMCVKSNCSKKCGCKKLNRSCTVGCRCSSTSCTNRDKIAETTGSLDEKKRRMEESEA